MIMKCLGEVSLRLKNIRCYFGYISEFEFSDKFEKIMFISVNILFTVKLLSHCYNVIILQPHSIFKRVLENEH